MKLVILLFIGFLFLSGEVFGQAISIHGDFYGKTKKRGTTASENDKFEDAIQYFFLARRAIDIEKEPEKIVAIDALIDKTLKKWVDLLETANDSLDTKNKQIAEYLKDAKDQNRLLYGYYVANKAIQNTLNGKPLLGMAKAFVALDSLGLDSLYRRTKGSLGEIKSIPSVAYLAFGNAVTQSMQDTIYQHKNGLIEMKLSKDGDYLLLVGRDKQISIWSLKDYSNPKNILHDKTPDYILCADITKNEQIIWGGRGSLRLKQFLSDSIIKMDPANTNAAIVKVYWITGTENFLSASRAGKVERWNTAGQLLETIIHTELPFIDLQLSQNGKYAMARTMHNIYYWEIEKVDHPTPLPLTEDLIYTATLSATGEKLVFSSKKGLTIWDIKEDTSATINQDDQLILTTTQLPLLLSSLNGQVISFGFTADFQKHINLQGAQVEKLAISSSGNQYAISTTKSLLLINDKAKIDTITGYQITALTFSPTQIPLLLIGTKSGRLILHDLKKHQRLIDTKFQKAITNTLFSKDGRYFYVTLVNGQVFSIPMPETAFKMGWDTLMPNINRDKIEQEIQEEKKRDLKNDK